MNKFYEAVGRLVVWAIRSRYQRQLRVAAALGVATVAAGAYLALKGDVEEG